MPKVGSGRGLDMEAGRNFIPAASLQSAGPAPAPPIRLAQLAPSAPIPGLAPLPPVFVPGTPENKQWTEQAIRVGQGLVDALQKFYHKVEHAAECERIYYEIDVPTCRGIARMRGARAGRRCYAAGAQRLANCLNDDPRPPLDAWNN